MQFAPISPDPIYSSDSTELDVLGSKQTRARHRHEGKGCPYIKIGGRVFYRGSDVLRYLEENTVQTVS